MARLNQFINLGILTIVATIFLIWVGGLVRSTGAGMGCPDWPKCFDCWIPPTDSVALPANYREHYIALREKKNNRVAKTLVRLGMSSTAEKILNDPSVHEDEPFNALKTWIEYLNRVVGVVVGFLIFFTTISAWRIKNESSEQKVGANKKPTTIFWLSLLGFVGVGFEGWLGSIVVSTNLMPSFITAHMIIALLILLSLITAVLLAQNKLSDLRSTLYNEKNIGPQYQQKKSLIPFYIGIAVCILVSAQILMGTQVRQQIDVIAKTLGEQQRDNWISHLSGVYNVHKYFYYLLAAVIVYWFTQLRIYFVTVSGVRLLSLGLLGLLFGEIAIGIGMHRFGIPAVVQPFHLLLAILIFSTAYTLSIKLQLYLNKSV